MTKREKIFNAGVKLFAERSYNSVGIRDIATAAGVNSAMISYYFGGKSGLLREIFSTFKERILNVIVVTMAKPVDHAELIDNNVCAFLDDAREHRDIYLVGLRELNHDSLELQDLRDDLDARSWKYFSEFLDKTGSKGDRTEDERDITFTAVIGIIFSDYLLGGGQFIDDDSKVEVYKSVISSILKRGSTSIWT